MLQGELSTTALQRQTEAVKLVHLIRGDLDWIAMKALEKDRSRRYDSATALAADVTRFLNNEPILARPPSNVYRLKKLALRNKLAFAATAAVLLALVAGLAVSTFLYWREKIANERAVVAEAKSRTAALQSDQVAQFLERMIEGVGPEAALGRDTTMMREILQKTEEQMGAELKDQPEVQARLCMSIAGVYDQLNDFAKTEALCQQAIALRRGAVGTNDPVLADWLDNLGMVQQQRGRFAEAEASLRQALEMEKRFMPPNAPPIGLTLLNLAGALRAKGDLPGAEAQIRDTLARARTGPPSDDGARLEGRALNDLGLILWGRGDLPNAASSFQEALTLIKKTHSGDSPESSTTLGNLGLVLWESGKFPEAEAVQRQTLALRIKILGAESNTLVASAYHNLSLVLRDEDRLAEAEADSRRSLEIETNLVGPNHPEAAIARKTLAGILRRRGAAETNAGLLREALHLNPSDGHAVEALAALSANPTMMAPVGAVTPWRYSAIDPGPHWNETAFSDAAWAADPPPRGAPRYLPRSEHTAPPATNLWLRQSLQLTSLPTGDVVFRVGRNHDAELFLNGVVAASVGWSDTARLVPCSAAARAALTPGANVLAMK
jgi:tetratricopeptide (TPR) repeat protein